MKNAFTYILSFKFTEFCEADIISLLQMRKINVPWFKMSPLILLLVVEAGLEPRGFIPGLAVGLSHMWFHIGDLMAWGWGKDGGCGVGGREQCFLEASVMSSVIFPGEPSWRTSNF